MTSMQKTTLFFGVATTVGILLALLNHYRIHTDFPATWVGLYGLMFLLGFSYQTSLTRLAITALISSGFASIYVVTQLHTTHPSFTAFVLSCTAVYALNAFYLHYQTHRFTIHYPITIHYPTLFYAVWDTAATLIITTFFVALCWLIISLSQALFQFIGINWIQILLSKNEFDIFVSCIFAGTGLFIAAESPTITHAIRTFLLLICRDLFIPLSLIGILFVVALAVQSWQHRIDETTQTVLLSIAFLSVLFLNAVYQDGTIEKPYPLVLHWICRIFVVITPTFSVLALCNTHINNMTYSALHAANNSQLTSFVATLLLLFYNVSYAVLALCRQATWFAVIKKINVVLAIVFITTTLVLFIHNTLPIQ